jgi:outer membrane protein
MFIPNSTSIRASIAPPLMPAVLVLLLAFSTPGLAQETAPQSSSPPPSPQQQTVATPSVLTPLPQAPAPQHNAHPYSDQDYTRGWRQWPNPFVIYAPRNVAPVDVQNSAAVGKIFRDGKIYLSIDDAIALALENNLDIGIQRFNLSIADTDVLRTSSGAAALGVNAGLLQGTPGGATGTTSAGGTGTSTTGTTGGGVGGTSIGVGGAGSGAAGLVTSTQGEGPPIDDFDPVITGTLSFERARLPESNTIVTGTNELSQNLTTGNFLYTQGFPTGTLMTVGFDNTRNSSSALFNTLNPNLNTNFRFQLRQHLLQGFGFDPNLRYIRIARNNKEITEITFRNQVLTTVSQIENIYWDLVNAYENVEVQQRALDLANKTLSDNTHGGAVAKRRRDRQAKSGCRGGCPAVAAIADEECDHAEYGRPGAGSRAGDSDRHTQHHGRI